MAATFNAGIQMSDLIIMVANNTHSKVFNAIPTSTTETFQDHLKVTCVF